MFHGIFSKTSRRQIFVIRILYENASVFLTFTKRKIFFLPHFVMSGIIRIFASVKVTAFPVKTKESI